ncbi:MAG: uroporphyrinogen decarboxylase family protein [Anaerolineae bacterium]
MVTMVTGHKKLHRLVDRVREIVDNTATPAWGDLWEHSAEVHTISMFSYPQPLAGTGFAPFVFSPDANFYARLLGYNLREVFTDTCTYLCFTLEQMIWNHEHLHHDAGVRKTILINMLGFFAPSLFGVEVIYADDAVPWIGDPVIRTPADFARLKPPDFYTSGLSPLAHRMYEEACYLLPDDFRVEFPTWLTGPFSLLFHLRGLENLAADIVDDPAFVHEMMGFVTSCMKEWWVERARFMGAEKLEPLILANDEVGAPMLGPQHYEEFVLPYEVDLCQYFGGIDYWHSCADVTPLVLPGCRSCA